MADLSRFDRVSPRRPFSQTAWCSEWHPGSWHPTPSSLKRCWSAGRTDERDVSAGYCDVWRKWHSGVDFETTNHFITPSQHTRQLPVPQGNKGPRWEERLQASDLPRVHEQRRSLDAGMRSSVSHVGRFGFQHYSCKVAMWCLLLVNIHNETGRLEDMFLRKSYPSVTGLSSWEF